MATPTMMPAGWYTDPAHRHEYRYWDGANWTAQVSDGGVTASDSLESPDAPASTPTPAPPPLSPQGPADRPPPAVPAPARRRRRAQWVALAAVLTALVLIGGYGLERALDTAGTYQADLTTGQGDFPVMTTGGTTTGYRPDGFHVRITPVAGPRFFGLDASSSFTAAKVTVTVTEVSSPADAGFGPLCYYNEDNGYTMDLASDGQVTIAYFRDGQATVIGGGKVEAWLPGQTRKLTLVCRFSDAGDRVSAFVNGVFVSDAVQRSSMPAMTGAGFVGIVPKWSSGPGEWLVKSYSRDNPANP